MSKTLRILPRAAGVAALLLLVAACGSSSKKSSDTTTVTPSESSFAFAGGVCSALGTWRSVVNDAIASVKASPSKSTATAAVDEVKTETSALAASVRALPLPQTTGSQEAKKALQTLNAQIQNDLAVIKRTAENVTVGNFQQAAADISTTTKTMTQQLGDARSSLQSLPDGELSHAFKTAPECTALNENGS